MKRNGNNNYLIKLVKTGEHPETLDHSIDEILKIFEKSQNHGLLGTHLLAYKRCFLSLYLHRGLAKIQSKAENCQGGN